MKVPYIVDIKENSLDDGIGIRSVIFFKGCALKCVWCQNPEAQNVNPELVYQPKNCIHCTPQCFVHCPNDAFNYPNMVLNRSVCILSQCCTIDCPADVFSVAGKLYTVNELVERFRSNMIFYRNSNGGISLSGGEPMMFPEFILNLIMRLREINIGIAIETCGLFPLNSQTKKILEQVQFIYYDVKIMNSNKHIQYCGVDNVTILENLKQLVKEGLVTLPKNNSELKIPASKPLLVPRIPLIPHITIKSDNLKEIAQFLKSLNISLIDLLPYNPLWIEKAHSIDHPVSYPRDSWMNDKEKLSAASFFKGFKFDTFVI
ncbi:MAG: glycyl-radical enzyme activating protein [Candidatus Lokiarchaeota archaeon]|nr:glycyl-radical enzyme activating protein [Candidatus Lokiarchaeota archaeon]